MTGKFFGIGVGPGDPDLITVKGLKMLKKADVICVPKSHKTKPSVALTLIEPILKERKDNPEIFELIFPMTKNQKDMKKLWVKNAKAVAEKTKGEKIVAFITLGDPMLYSTFLYIFHHIKEKYPEVKIDIIPGVTSITASAACAQLPLAENEEVISIIPSDFNSKIISKAAKYSDTIVLIKHAHKIKEISPLIKKTGFCENSIIAFVKRCTLPEQEVFVGTLKDLEKWDIIQDYFSVAIIKKMMKKRR